MVAEVDESAVNDPSGVVGVENASRDEEGEMDFNISEDVLNDEDRYGFR